MKKTLLLILIFSLFSINNYAFHFKTIDTIPKKEYKYYHFDDRSDNAITIGFGMHNVIENRNFSTLNDSEFKFWRSTFLEIGFIRDFRLIENSYLLDFRYGFSFTWNNLYADNGKYFVRNNGNTTLENYDGNLKSALFKIVRFEIPIFLEFNIYNYEIGFGMYGGAKLSSKQCLKYISPDGTKHKDKVKNEFGVTDFNYGFSTYLGYKSYYIYLKYSPTPIFRNSDLSSLFLGLKFDLH
ncbi:hypothetical protein [Aureivirga marina]|uniref:hypothetical protein n=1 Tax=Aureivirga marina TaxID=1182451 RepID=UPI0018C919BB|nr:hypothetical protein [Aureivirga marina]